VILAGGVSLVACASTPHLEFAGDDAASPSDAALDGDVDLDAATDALVDASDGAADATVCKLTATFRVATCDTCLAASCCVQANECAAVPACLALAYCLQDCVAEGGDATDCRQACRTKHPGGVAKAAPLAQCISGTCTTCF